MIDRIGDRPQSDPLVAAFRALQTSDPRLQGFDMGVGITKIDKSWGPGKQRSWMG